MKKVILFFLATTIIFNLYPQRSENNISTEEKIFAVSKIWKEVGENFPFFDRFHENYWDSLYYSNISKIINTKTDYEFYEILESMVNRLYEGHTKIILPNEFYEFQNQKIARPDIYVKWLNDGFYIISISEDNENKIQLGSKILRIDDINIDDYLHKNKLPLTFFDHSQKYYQPYFLLNGKENSTVKIKTIQMDGQIKEAVLTRNLHPKSKIIHLNKESLYLEHGKNNLQFSINEENIAYLNLGGFMSNDIVDFFKSKIDSIKTCKGLILDLRFSEGGSSIGDLIVNYFSKQDEYISYKALVRINNSYYKALGGYTDTALSKFTGGNLRHFEYQDYYKNNIFDTIVFYSKKEDKTIDIPVVALCSPSVVSASETFLISFQNAKAGVVIGQASFGSCTQPYIVKLDKIGYLMIATQKSIYPDNRILDFVEPDIIINPTLKGFIEGRDEILEAGYNYLKNLKK
ncbi:MAG: S41 family peptidase [Bacteroidales bacterium]|nr:S41 family peptidase [Bacteroidales bacterium]MDD4574970.1 S41 family peptidase [Bacteroidales bacterium]